MYFNVIVVLIYDTILLVFEAKFLTVSYLSCFTFYLFCIAYDTQELDRSEYTLSIITTIEDGIELETINAKLLFLGI